MRPPTKYKRIAWIIASLRFCATLMCAFILGACSSKLGESAFEGIQQGAEKEAVIQMLGQPTRTKAASVYGQIAEQLEWEEEGRLLKLVMVNDKVKYKTLLLHVQDADK